MDVVEVCVHSRFTRVTKMDEKECTIDSIYEEFASVFLKGIMTCILTLELSRQY
jgi:hypothetical protein